MTIGKGFGFGPPEWGGKQTEGEAARTRTMASSTMVEVSRIVIENSLAFRFVYWPTNGHDFISES